MPKFKLGKLVDFFKHFDPDSPQHREAVKRLESVIEQKAPELLSDEAYWVQAFRTRPKPEPVSRNRQINEVGLALIKGYETLQLKSYDDQTGVWTIGWGHTGPEVKPGQTITKAQADELLRKDLRRFETAVSDLVDVPLNENQFAALVSLVFNIGEGEEGFAGSTLLKLLNKGDYKAAAEWFAPWNKGGQPLRVLEGLTLRRAKEKALFLTPVHGAKASAVAINLESKVRVLSQRNAVSCGQTSVAMVVNALSGSHITDAYINERYGFSLLSALNRETPAGVRYRDAGNFTPGLWDDIKESLEFGLPVIIALNGSEFSPSGYGHIMVIAGMDERTVRIADPNGGRWRTISRQLVEKSPPHSESGNFVFLGERV